MQNIETKKYPNPFSRKDNFARYRHVQSKLLWGNPSKIKNPWISVIIPSFNHPTLFREALISAINQNFDKEYEIIVVDNNPLSEIKTENQIVVEELNSPKVLYYRNEENIGAFGNWNRGIELSNAPFYTLLHDDDKLLPSCLASLYRLHFEVAHKAILVPYLRMYADGNCEKLQPFVPHKRLGGIIMNNELYRFSLLNLIIKMPTPGGGCLFSKECAIKIGGYDEDQFPGGDYAFLANYAKDYGLVQLRTPQYIYRIAENESLTVWPQFKPFNNNLWHCMKPYIKIPDFILNRLISAMTNSCFYHAAIDWGKQDPQTLTPPSKNDVRIIKFFQFLCDLNKFKLTLPWK